MCNAEKTATEIIEPSGEISAEEYENLMTFARMELNSSDALAICGTYPPGIPQTCYADLTVMAASQGKPVLLDTVKGVEPALLAGAEILKINRGELLSMTGKETVEEGIRFCFEKYPLKVAAITAGKEFAVIGTPKKMTRISVPQISNAINPIGAGDTCAGVFFSEYISGTEPAEAFSRGLCAATASCMTGCPAEFDNSVAKSLRTQIEFF